jgi:hypothetical protein
MRDGESDGTATLSCSMALPLALIFTSVEVRVP